MNDDASQFWDKTARKYAKSPIADEAAYQLTLDRTRHYLSKEDHVLEVGCGTGSTALLLAKDVAHITASDFSDTMIEIAEEKRQAEDIANVQFIKSSIADIQHYEKPYDVVMALNVLHLIEDLPKALSEIHDLVKPGGIFISKTVCQLGSSAPMKYRLLKLILPLMQWLGKAPFVQFMQVSELENALTSAGFEIVESDNYPKTAISRYIVARKIG